MGKVIQQFAKRCPAVRDGEFFFRMDFRKRLTQRRVEKIRIVPEAAGASWFVDDHAVGLSFHHRDDPACFCQSNHADVMGGSVEQSVRSWRIGNVGAAWGFDLVKICQQALIVLFVGGLRVGITCGIDARRSVEPVNTKS